MKKTTFLIMISFVFIAVSLALAADIPMMLNYQGYVEYDDGAQVNGIGYFKFAIVDTNGNTTYWSNDETRTAEGEPDKAVPINVTNGVFTVKLGNTDITNMSTLPTTIFDQQNIYVRVWFSDDGTNFDLLSPDTQIVSTGFAYKAQTVVDSAVNSTIIQDGTITNADISSTASIDASKIDTAGLDADTLDGKDSSEFATEDHTHTNYAQIKHSHSGSEITSDTIPNERLDPDLQDLADGSLSASRVQYGTYFIDSQGESGQVWKSDGSGKGSWGTDNTGGGGSLWSQSGNNIYYNLGNVGIGTTSLSFPLSLGSSISKTKLALYETGPDNSYGLGVTPGHFLLHLNGSGSKFAFMDDDKNDANEIFTIKGTGNVGIGTTNPQYKLHVLGTSAAGSVIWLTNTGDSVISYLQSYSDRVILSACTNHPLVFQTSNNERVRITNTGNVGIGTTSPGAKLDVKGGSVKVHAPEPFFLHNDSVNRGWEIFQMTGGNGIHGLAFREKNLGILTTRMSILPGGNVGIGTPSTSYRLHVNGTAYATGAAGALSDYRHKMNINNISFDALELINDLRPVSFEWKEPQDSGMEGTQLGFIAQEVEEVLPEAVLTQDNDEQTKGLKYSALIPLLTKAIQELEAQNEALKLELEAQNEALKAENNILRHEIEQIKEAIGL